MAGRRWGWTVRACLLPASGVERRTRAGDAAGSAAVEQAARAWPARQGAAAPGRPRTASAGDACLQPSRSDEQRRQANGACLQPGCGRRAAACEPRLPPRRPWARSGDRTRHLVAWPPRIACSGKNRDGACVREICCFDVLGWSTRKMGLLVVLAMEKSEGVRASGLCYCSYLAS